MKKFIPLTLAALGLLALPQARAWPYSDGDVLLIFRDGAKMLSLTWETSVNLQGKPTATR